MRVGVIGPVGDDEFATNIADCLPDVGAEAVLLGSARSQPDRRRLRSLTTALAETVPPLDKALQEGTVRRALDAELDVVINVDRWLLHSSVQRMRKAGIKAVLWFPDHLVNLSPRVLGAPYDHVFFKDPELVERMAGTYGSPVSYLPEACNPRWHRPIGEPGVAGGVAVVGNLYVTRALLLNRLAADGVRLTLHGAGWPLVAPEGPATRLPVGPRVYREDKARVFREASGVLNNLHPAELSGVNCRLFEATGSGGAVLCEDRPALRELFDVGTEVLAFGSYDELLGHVRRLADDPELTRKIGDAASARAHSEHSYQQRLRRILEVVA